MIEPLSPDEKAILKTAAFGAVYLVSNAEPGFFAMLKESFAASDAISRTTGVVKEALTTGGLPRLPRESPDLVGERVFPALGQAVQILAAKAPDEVPEYRRAVLSAVEEVARASHGVQGTEAAVIERIRLALGM